MLDKIVKQDSRNAAWLGNAVGWQGLEDEANKNVKNPGRAMTKAAISAATWYLGGAAGNALGGAGSAAGTAGSTAAEAAPTTSAALSAANAFQGMSGMSTQQLAQAAMQNAALSQAGQGSGLIGQYMSTLAPEAEQGLGGMGVAQNGIGPGGLLSQFRGAVNNPSSLMSANGMPANLAKGLLGGGSQGKTQELAMKMGLNSMQQQQPQQGPMAPPPRQQGEQGPLPLPYGQPGQQNSVNGSMPPPGMSYEEWMRRKQMMGY